MAEMDLIGWWLRLAEGERASWAQFAATVLGLAIAIAVPWWTHRADRKERRKRDEDRARDVALAILDDLKTMRDRAGQFEDCLKEELPDFIQLYDMPGIRTQDYLFVPPGITSRAGELHNLGDAAKPVQHMLALYRILMSDVLWAMMAKAFGAFGPAEHKTLSNTTRRCVVACEKAYLTTFELFAEIHPQGPQEMYIEPPISREALSRLKIPES